MTTIFITGATGTIGNQLARELLGRNVTVKVGTRRPEAAAELARLGAEVVALDLEQPEQLEAAFTGADRLFSVGPQSRPEFGAQVGEVLAAARRAGVRFALRLSALGADPASPTAASREHGIAEQKLEQSGLDWAVLRPTFFQDNLVKFHGAAIAGSGAFYGASHGGRVAYVSSADIARVAADILQTPTPHHGERYALTGPESLTDGEVASLVTEAIGKPVRYVDVSAEQLGSSMREQGAPESMIELIVALEAVKERGYAAEVSPAVQQLTGRAAESLLSFATRHRDQLL